jgi:energy-coupling factor transport system permease protein
LELISGLYSLFAPLKFLGMSRERCAIRLALTLHYAEVAMLRSDARWQDALQGLFESPAEVVHPIALPLHRMRLRDAVMSLLLGLFMLGLVLR